MEADRLKWNECYVTKPENCSPDSFLQKNIHLLQKPCVLDIAGGMGRNAFFLASQGFEVTMVDFAEVGFQRMANNLLQPNFNIKTILLDLDNPMVLKNEGEFESVVCINFRPEQSLLQLIPSLVKPNGMFLWCSFNELQALSVCFPLNKSLKLKE